MQSFTVDRSPMKLIGELSAHRICQKFFLALLVNDATWDFVWCFQIVESVSKTKTRVRTRLCANCCKYWAFVFRCQD